jgi:pimeloyl-ACP methyl ester carboxylesterase
MSEKVLGIMVKPDADEHDLLYLFYPDTEAARAAGLDHLTKVSTRLAAEGPAVSETAASRQLEAIGKALSVPFEQVRSNLHAIKQPVLYANGMHDVMIPAVASYVAVEHLDSATLLAQRRRSRLPVPTREGLRDRGHQLPRRLTARPTRMCPTHALLTSWSPHVQRQ